MLVSSIVPQLVNVGGNGRFGHFSLYILSRKEAVKNAFLQEPIKLSTPGNLFLRNSHILCNAWAPQVILAYSGTALLAYSLS